MTYGPLPAGSYRGALGRHRPGPSRQGAAIRGADVRRVVTLGGLGALGDPNLCTDPGWVAARTVVGGGSDLLSSFFQPSTTKAEGSTELVKTGSSTGYAITQGVNVAADAWAAGCAQDTINQNTQASERNTQMFMDQMRAQADANARQMAQNQQNFETLSLMLAQRGQQPQTSKSGIDTNTLLIGGAIVGAGLLAVLLLR